MPRGHERKSRCICVSDPSNSLTRSDPIIAPKARNLPILALEMAATFRPIARTATQVKTRTSRSIDSPPLAWPIRPFAEDAHE
jgi:hypothetical protein